MVYKSDARICAWLEALGIFIQHKALLRQIQIHIGIARPNAPVCGRRAECLVRRFQNKNQDCCDSVVEDVLVDSYFHGMIKDYWIYLESFSFSFFSRLTEAARQTNEVVRKLRLCSEVPRGWRKFEDNAMVLYEKYRQILPSDHNMPLYVTSSIHNLDLKRALIDAGFSKMCIDWCRLLFEQHFFIDTRSGGDHLNQNCWTTDRSVMFWRQCIIDLTIEHRMSSYSFPYHWCLYLVASKALATNTRLYPPRTVSVSESCGKSRKCM